MKTTINDIAKKAGLSPTTVSKYLNHKPLRAQNIDKIEKAIAELQYEPSTAAQNLRLQKSDNVHIIISDLGNYFWGPAIAQINQRLAQFGYPSLVQSYYYQESTKKALIERMISQNPCGAILLATDIDDDTYQLLSKASIPTVVVNQIPSAFHKMPIDCVLSDGYAGGVVLAEYLIKKGHKKVYIEAPVSNSISVRKNIAGILDTYQQHSLPTPHLDEATKFQKPEILRQYAQNSIQNLLTLPDPPTAIIFTSYDFTMGGLSALQSFSLHLPEDLSIVAYDDDILFQCISPSITAVGQDFEKLGTLAADTLIQRMRGDYSDFPSIKKVPVSFTERNSVYDIRETGNQSQPLA